MKKEDIKLEEAVVETAIVNDGISDLEREIIAKSEVLNEPALCAFFSVSHEVVRAALDKK